MLRRKKQLGALILYAGLIGQIFSASAESCLWKATKGDATLYLQGSVHVLKPENYPLAPAIEEAYEASDTLVLEVDMKDMLSPQTQQLIMQRAFLPEGHTLRDELSEKTYDALVKMLDEAGLQEAAFQRFKPWFAAITLTMTRMQQLGFNPQLGLDQYFYKKAQDHGKKVVGLETVEFQVGLFDSLTAANPNEFMQHNLDEMKLLDQHVEKLMNAWKNGDLEIISDLMLDTFKDYPELYESFLLERNAKWMNKLDAMAQNEAVPMVVVGAAHLAGKGGLIELLEQNGYTLEQL